MKSQNKAAFFFLLPNFVGFLIFALGPVVVACRQGGALLKKRGEMRHSFFRFFKRRRVAAVGNHRQL